MSFQEPAASAFTRGSVATFSSRALRETLGVLGRRSTSLFATSLPFMKSAWISGNWSRPP